ncbi:O-methyltransferase [Abyssisolibacter fermentans]|uniref:O-methyltransferase n=1 Tax=Abyssisolibacter fermentans TaxID=1766203 RepID=UPI0008368EF0|nr:O-methyltransferase [Abyssisolibacter fermentans]
MENINRQYIVDYIQEVIPKNNKLLQKLESYAKDNNVPIIHPEVAQLLKVIMNIKKPKKILEIGTAIGYSALLMAYYMKDDGKIITIERRKEMIDIALNNIKENGFSDKITIKNGEAHEILPQINEKFDLIFIDAAKSKYMEFLSCCLNCLSKDGIIVSDNVLYKGMIANDDLVPRRQRTIVRKMRAYLDYICNDEKFESSIIPIGDGVAITTLKEENNYE